MTQNVAQQDVLGVRASECWLDRLGGDGVVCRDFVAARYGDEQRTNLTFVRHGGRRAAVKRLSRQLDPARPTAWLRALDLEG